MAEDSGAVTGQGYNSPKLNTLKDYFTWLSCTDSDGGIDITKKGELKATYDSNGVKGTKSYSDSCAAADTVKEYYCVSVNKFSYQDLKCPKNVCIDGVCVLCGDGVVQGSEQCDDGNAMDNDGCSATCLTETKGGGLIDVVDLPVCGDSLVQGTEQCDDGNQVSGDGCSSSCQTETPVNKT